MSIRTHAIEPQTTLLPDRLGEMISESFVGQVLSVQNWTGPEPHWDSGRSAETGKSVTVFNGRKWTLILSNWQQYDYTSKQGYVVTVDASAAVAIAANEWQCWVDWFASMPLRDRAKEASLKAHNTIVPGRRVLVVKGRKVARGTHWFVHKTGQGDYGPFVHLSSEPDGMGEYIRFVNPDNLTVSDPFTYAIDYWYGCPVQTADPIVLTLAHSWNALRRGAYGQWDKVYAEECAILFALADRLEELGMERDSATVRAAALAPRPDCIERTY